MPYSDFLMGRQGDEGDEGGEGDVTLPESSTDGNFVAFNGTTGDVLQDSGYNAASFATAAQGTTANNALPRSGGTMTGDIVLHGAPTVDLHPATKKYVDDEVAAFVGGGGGLVAANNLSDLDSVATARVNLGVVGKNAIWIPAGGITARTTNGPAAGTSEMTTNKNMFVTLDFDASTQEYAQFDIRMPEQWNEGTVTFVPLWSHAATTTNFGVVWQLAGVAMGNDDAGDAAFGTAQSSSDTGGTTNDIYFGPESLAVTITGTAQPGDLVQFRITRLVSDGGDTMAIDARLHGVVLYITTNAGNDA